MSAPKLDLETILDSVVTLFNSKFNTKLSSISTEKNDSITLAQLDSRAFGLLSLNEKVMNYDPFIAVLIDDLKSTGIKSATATVASMFIICVKEDAGMDAEMHRKMLRYQRAVQEVLEENWDDLTTGSFYEIQGLAPQQLKGLNTSKLFRGAGVVVQFPFTS